MPLKTTLTFASLLCLALSSFAGEEAVLHSHAPKRSAASIQTGLCRPPAVELPEGFAPKEMYFASRPSLLPDGKRFVFEWCDTLWIADTAGGMARILQRSEGLNAWPLVSPDGTRVAFQSSRSGAWQIYVAGLSEGSSARQVTHHSEGARPLMWSKDGKELLCMVFLDASGSPFDGHRLAWISVDERRAERYLFDAPGDQPALSPDGRYLLFVLEGEGLYRKGFTGENAASIWCYDMFNHTFALVVKRQTESDSPVWAPDGKGFYYVSGQDGTRNLWYRTYPEGKETQITFYQGDSVIAPTLSADGQTMIFRQGFWFYSMNPTTPEVAPKRIGLLPENRSILPQPTMRRSFSSVWNNDGPGALTSTSGGMEFAFTAGGDLWVMDTTLREPRCVYGDSRTHERDCVFSADGKKLYFLSDRGSDVALLVAEKAQPSLFWWENTEFNVRPLVEDNVRRNMLSISRDGSKLAWVERGAVFVIADAEGNVIRRFKPRPSLNAYDWSPDGKWIVMAYSDAYENQDIWILSAEDESIEPYNLSRNFSWDGNPSWSPDGKIILWQGVRPDTKQTYFYVWLDRHDEEALSGQTYRRALEKMGVNPDSRTFERVATAHLPSFPQSGSVEKPSEPTTATTEYIAPKENLPTVPTVTIDFDGLYDRIHVIPNLENVGCPFFSYDSRTVIFPATIKGRPGTYKIVLPDQLTPTFLTDTWGYPVRWYAPHETKTGGDRLVWLNNKYQVATYTEPYPFLVHQTLNLSDYQELGFLSAWGQLNDNFYDNHFHGADWDAVRKKYQAAARFAPTRSVFMRVMNALNGELNASHTGFYDTPESIELWGKAKPRQYWQPVTTHLGIIFDYAYKGETGWRVKHIIANGPADTPQHSIKVGDIVLAIDGHPVYPGLDPTLLLNGPVPGKYVLDVKGADGVVRPVFIEGITYTKARELLHKEARLARREYVHRQSGDRFGYVTIEQMNDAEYYRFEQEIFAEGFDKDGMIIDVRDNTGGFTADRVLNILGVQRHSWSVARHGHPGYLSSYWGRPVFDRPIVVLCNQNTVSNGEIFSHAIKQLKRGPLIGIQTNGGVIATRDMPLLDLGKLRHPLFGWYTLDGTDMELCGAMPDIVVINTPADIDAGRDPQLDAAIQSLTEEVSKAQLNSRPFSPRTYTHPHKL